MAHARGFGPLHSDRSYFDDHYEYAAPGRENNIQENPPYGIGHTGRRRSGYRQENRPGFARPIDSAPVRPLGIVTAPPILQFLAPSTPPGSNFGLARPNFHQPLFDWEMRQFMVIDVFENLQQPDNRESTTPTTCSVCLEDFAIGVERGRLECAHVFHVRCVENWLLVSPTCPQCRYNVRMGPTH